MSLIIRSQESGNSLICFFIAALIFSGAFGANRGLDQRIVFSILGLVFLLPPVFGIYMLITRRGSSVTLYEKGLIYRRGGKEFGTTWDDIYFLSEEEAAVGRAWFWASTGVAEGATIFLHSGSQPALSFPLLGD